MKRFILFFIAVFCFAACQIDDMQTYDTVQVFASISIDSSTRVSDDGASFTDGDVIRVENTSRQTNNIATYTYSSSSDTWATDDVMLWEGQGDNLFKGWYPATASFGSFTIPVDQSAGNAAADWMTATASAKSSDGGVGLLFSHHLVKVTVEAASWGSEFAQDDQEIESLDLLSLSTVMANDGTAVSGDGTTVFVKACPVQSGAAFVALVAPGTYPSGAEIMHIQVGDEQLVVQTSGALEIQAGKAYAFKVNVGKDMIVVSSDDVTVSEWDDVTLDDQEFEEILFQLQNEAHANYQAPFYGGEVTIPLLCNTTFEVSVEYLGTQKDWISYNDLSSKASSLVDLVFTVAENKSGAERSAKITVSMPLTDYPIEINFTQPVFNGIDESAFDPDKYLVYVRNRHGYRSGDNYTADVSYFACPVSFKKIEYKFQLASIPADDAYVSLGSTNYARDSYVDLCIKSSGIKFKDINGDNPDYFAEYTWEEMGVSPIDVLTITLDATDKSVTVNGKKLTGSGFAVGGLSQLFSNYFRESDDGVLEEYDGFVEESKLYYVKMWDSQNRLIYLGSAAKAYNGRTATNEACWVSSYYYDGRIFKNTEFAHYCSKLTSYQPFGMGNL